MSLHCCTCSGILCDNILLHSLAFQHSDNLETKYPYFLKMDIFKNVQNEIPGCLPPRKIGKNGVRCIMQQNETNE